MKKLFAALVLVLAMATVLQATPLHVMDYRPPGVGVTMKMAALNTLLNAEDTAGTTGSAVDLGTYVGRGTCTVVWGGTAPTDMTVDILGSIDGTSYVSLVSHTAAASPAMFHLAYKPVRWVKGKYTSKTDGDATTTCTIKCAMGGE